MTTTIDSISSPAQRRRARRSADPLSVTLGRFSALFLWVGFIILFGIITGDTFFTTSTWELTFSEGVVTAMLALAFLVPLVAGVFDLSVGAMMGLSLVIVNWFGANQDVPIGLVAVMAIVICALVGLISAVIVVNFRVNSLIATLGMSQVLIAVQLKISNNRQITGAFSDELDATRRRRTSSASRSSSTTCSSSRSSSGSCSSTRRSAATCSPSAATPTRPGSPASTSSG